MSRLIISLLIVLSLFPIVTAMANDYALDIDLKDALHSRRLESADLAKIEELPKGVIEGDIYSTSYARAELQIAQPGTDALQSTYEYIAAHCDGQIAVSDVTTVFAITDAGKEISTYLSNRGIIDEFAESESYNTSCVNVVKCFYEGNPDFTEIDLNSDKLEYENKVRILCEDIVTDSYDMMLTSVQALADMKDINYGDDMLINAKRDDGPFDILADIEKVGNVLFSHNDTATEIHFYDVQTPDSYVDNDPDTITPFQETTPNADEDDSLRRLPASSGVDPDFPRSIYYDDAVREPEAIYAPPTEPRQDFSLYTDPISLGGSPAENEILQQALGPATETPASSTLQNNVCNLEDEEELVDPNILVLAELQQSHTYTYNKKLDMNTRVALASATIMLPEIEEKYGIDPVEVLEEGGVDPRSVPDLINREGLDGVELEAIENGMMNCVEQFTDMQIGEDGETKKLDKNAVRKIVRKSITQPTAFTNCVMDLMCFEVGDETGRGLFRIRGCTIPSRKAYGVADDLKVVSIEEALDEFMNVCTSLEESGQLLEHNKTKDARDHKLMRVDFGEKFNFSMSVGFKPLSNDTDPGYEKRMARENTAYLEDALLNINDNHGHIEQRNRYTWLYDSLREGEETGINTKEQSQSLNNAIEKAQTPGDEVNSREEYSQLTTHAEVLDVLDEFIDLNTEYRVSINDITHSIMQNRQAEMKESQQKS